MVIGEVLAAIGMGTIFGFVGGGLASLTCKDKNCLRGVFIACFIIGVMLGVGACQSASPDPFLQNTTYQGKLMGLPTYGLCG